jgi:hypothetical protein
MIVFQCSIWNVSWKDEIKKKLLRQHSERIRILLAAVQKLICFYCAYIYGLMTSFSSPTTRSSSYSFLKSESKHITLFSLRNGLSVQFTLHRKVSFSFLPLQDKQGSTRCLIWWSLQNNISACVKLYENLDAVADH